MSLGFGGRGRSLTPAFVLQLSPQATGKSSPLPFSRSVVCPREPAGLSALRFRNLGVFYSSGHADAVVLLLAGTLVFRNCSQAGLLRSTLASTSFDGKDLKSI